MDVLIAKDQVQANSRASNVYRRAGSEWRMVHHRFDFDPTIREALSKLETSRQSNAPSGVRALGSGVSPIFYIFSRIRLHTLVG